MMSLRRSRIATISAAVTSSLRELTGAGPKSGVVFHHIPKCAGVSVTTALVSVYAPWTYRKIEAPGSVAAIRFLDLRSDTHGPFDVTNEAWTQIHQFRQRLLFNYLHSGAKSVSGHVMYSPRIHDAFEKTHKFVTVLRHPVDRFVSQYLYSSRSQSYDHVDVSWDADGLSKLGPIWGRTITTFLGGADDSRGRLPSTERMVENAKLALDRLDVIGFVDDLSKFEGDVAHQIGARITIGRHNRSSQREKETIELSELRPLIEEFCAPDIEVYNHARLKFSV
ncbi:sulfotransferase family 2 domain-containing protein [Rhodospirillaceae bacterium SYSU D60014]|uniref:sulfotransferase family 2 domain-containing protein n=1 Tax=Virgifigura deserti TaxID=2268457 RepID=UPI0013C436F5